MSNPIRKLVLAGITILLWPWLVWGAQPEEILRETFDQELQKGWEFSCQKKLLTEGSGCYLQLSGAGHAIYPLETESYVLKFRVRSKEANGVADVILGTPSSIYYAVTLHSEAIEIGQRDLQKPEAEKRLKTAPSQLEADKWHDITVRVVKGALEVTVNSQQVLKMENLQPAPYGPVGLGVIEGAQAVDYDDIVISGEKGSRKPVASQAEGTEIDTITVTLEVGQDGEDLKEPVTLDLGLGFPLWLSPLGREPGESPPFWAIPQQSNALQVARAGTKLHFTFDRVGEPGQDVFQTTRQLLAGVKLSDITRVGFCSVGETDWKLASYKITINGQPFASSDTSNAAVQQKGQTELSAVQSELAKIHQQIQPLKDLQKPNSEDQQRLAQLHNRLSQLLIQKSTLKIRYKLSPSVQEAQQAANLRLAEIDQQLQSPPSRTQKEPAQVGAPPPKVSSLLQEKQRLEYQLQGRYPWFVDADYKKFQPVGDPIQSAKVLVETYAHAGADTKNLVFLGIAGRKYLVNRGDVSLSAQEGPRGIDLDLLSGPLRDLDFSRILLGTLATRENVTSVPDRWHPRRIQLLIDGQVRYDSEEQLLDRNSLKSIRLVPPAQLESAGKAVQNSATAREVFLWFAGQGKGLSEEGLQAASLPEPDEAGFPEVEDGLQPKPTQPSFPDEPETQLPDDSEQLPGKFPDDGSAYGFSPQFPPLPGENAPGPGWFPPSGALPPGADPAVPVGPLSPSVFPSPAAVVNPPQLIAQTTGTSFQIETPWISSGWQKNGPFEVKWKVTGDASQIDHFDVLLRIVRPDQPKFLLGTVVKQQNIPPGQRSVVLKLGPDPTSVPYYYIAPQVVAWPKKGITPATPHSKDGPARAVFPDNISPHIGHPVPQSTLTFKNGTGTPNSGTIPLATAGPPSSSGRAAWFTIDAQTPHALPFGTAAPASHVVVRPQAGDETTLVYVAKPFQGEQQLVGHFGFSGTTTGTDQYDAVIQCTLIPKRPDANPYDYPPVQVSGISTNNLVKPLPLVEKVIREADLGVKADRLEIKVTLKNGGWLDHKCNPAVFGMRLVPVVPGSAPKTHPINADLEIVGFPVPGVVRNFHAGPSFGSPARVTIQNNGPEDIPAETLKKIKVEVIYYLGQYGKKWHEVHNTKFRDIIDCTPQSLNDVGPGTATWPGGGLRSGQVIQIVPMKDTHNRLDPLNGHVKLTEPRSAFKVLMVWVNLHMPGPHLLKDPDLTNNGKHWEPTSSLVIGKGPLDTEVLLFENPDFKGAIARYELNPDLQRQRLVWDVAAGAGPVPGLTNALNPAQPNLREKVSSIWVGKEVDVLTWNWHHFYNLGEQLPPLIGKSPSTEKRWLPKNFDNKVESLILCPKTNYGPVGVEAICDAESSGFFFPDDKDLMFFPLPEDKTIKQADFDTVPMNDAIDRIHVWRHPQDPTPGGPPLAPATDMQVTIYEDAKFGGWEAVLGPNHLSYTLSPVPGWKQNAYNFDFSAYKNEISSLKLKLK